MNTTDKKKKPDTDSNSNSAVVSRIQSRTVSREQSPKLTTLSRLGSPITEPPSKLQSRRESKSPVPPNFKKTHDVPFLKDRLEELEESEKKRVNKKLDLKDDFEIELDQTSKAQKEKLSYDSLSKSNNDKYINTNNIFFVYEKDNFITQHNYEINYDYYIIDNIYDNLLYLNNQRYCESITGGSGRFLKFFDKLINNQNQIVFNDYYSNQINKLLKKPIWNNNKYIYDILKNLLYIVLITDVLHDTKNSRGADSILLNKKDFDVKNNLDILKKIIDNFNNYTNNKYSNLYINNISISSCDSQLFIFLLNLTNYYNSNSINIFQNNSDNDYINNCINNNIFYKTEKYYNYLFKDSITSFDNTKNVINQTINKHYNSNNNEYFVNKIDSASTKIDNDITYIFTNTDGDNLENTEYAVLNRGLNIIKKIFYNLDNNIDIKITNIIKNSTDKNYDITYQITNIKTKQINNKFLYTINSHIDTKSTFSINNIKKYIKNKDFKSSKESINLIKKLRTYFGFKYNKIYNEICLLMKLQGDFLKLEALTSIKHQNGFIDELLPNNDIIFTVDKSLLNVLLLRNLIYKFHNINNIDNNCNDIDNKFTKECYQFGKALLVTKKNLIVLSNNDKSLYIDYNLCSISNYNKLFNIYPLYNYNIVDNKINIIHNDDKNLYGLLLYSNNDFDNTKFNYNNIYISKSNDKLINILDNITDYFINNYNKKINIKDNKFLELLEYINFYNSTFKNTLGLLVKNYININELIENKILKNQIIINTDTYIPFIDKIFDYRLKLWNIIFNIIKYFHNFIESKYKYYKNIKSQNSRAFLRTRLISTNYFKQYIINNINMFIFDKDDGTYFSWNGINYNKPNLDSSIFKNIFPTKIHSLKLKQKYFNKSSEIIRDYYFKKDSDLKLVYLFDQYDEDIIINNKLNNFNEDICINKIKHDFNILFNLYNNNFKINKKFIEKILNILGINYEILGLIQKRPRESSSDLVTLSDKKKKLSSDISRFSGESSSKRKLQESDSKGNIEFDQEKKKKTELDKQKDT